MVPRIGRGPFCQMGFSRVKTGSPQTLCAIVPGRFAARKGVRSATRSLVMDEIRKHRDDDAGGSEPPDDVDLF